MSKTKHLVAVFARCGNGDFAVVVSEQTLLVSLKEKHFY